MNDEIKQNLINYLASHNYARLATVTIKGNPLVRTVAYVSEEATIYFATDERTRKVQDILNNPNVAYSVDENYEDITKIQGVQIEGEASLLSEKYDIDKIAALLMKKFGNLPELPSDFKMAFVKVEPKRAFFIDYTKGFTHVNESVVPNLIAEEKNEKLAVFDKCLFEKITEKERRSGVFTFRLTKLNLWCKLIT